jgi:hypothetical protein
LPKTFLAVNLSDVFSFEDQEKQSSGEADDVLEMKTTSKHETMSTNDDDASKDKESSGGVAGLEEPPNIINEVKTTDS